ncbi:MAG: family 78 glycoside hydrolase catalytic domain [Lapillicoccus sp.]
MTPIVVSAPTFEHHREPLGIGEATPRLSWKTTAPAGWVQAAYEVRLEGEGPGGRLVGGSSATSAASADSVLVPWPGAPLTSRERVTARVRVTGADRSVSEWSAPATVEAGLIDPQDWRARPVHAGWPEDRDSDTRRPPLLRRELLVREGLQRARVYASAHGVFELEIDGRRVGDDVMAPGWTAYQHRLRYRTYDVTDRLVPGAHAIGAWLGDGWYRGRLGWNGGFRNVYGSDLSLIAQVELTYADGTVDVVATDGEWRAAPSPIVHTGNYDGETYDARLEREGWSSPGFDDSDWTPVVVGERDPVTLVAPDGPPVRCTQELRPVSVVRTPSGRQVLDFGQNLVGRLRIRLSGPRGSEVVIRTAEVMQEGEIYTRPLRTARSTDAYTLAGREREDWEPRFTFHGFRYAEVSGWPGVLEAAVAAGDIVARVLHTDMERTGWFTCSDPLVERLHENVVWSMRGNFLDIPTDCPQRDERVGWTGDLQVFAPTATFLYDVSGMLSGWLKDVALEQLPDGTVPWYVPVIPAHAMWTPIRPGAVWGDVAVLTPWTLFDRFGDLEVLRRQYDSARRWVDLVERLAGPDRLWDSGFQLGDWLDPAAPPHDPADARTDRYLVATAYFAWSTDRLSATAHALGRADDARRYAGLAAEVRAAFVARYVGPDGVLTSDAQTAYALAITFDLLPLELRARAGRRLAELVAESGHRIATGFAGTPAVTDALSRTGHVDAAYDLLLETQAPSWLYAVTQGATTIWERWDSLLPDGTVNSGSMTSFNHYALGAVADWLHRVVAGLAPAAPGYREILVRPRPGGGLTSASAEHETPYGPARVAWEVVADRLVVDVTVPTGAVARIDLPGMPVEQVASGPHRFEVSWEREPLSTLAR